MTDMSFDRFATQQLSSAATAMTHSAAIWTYDQVLIIVKCHAMSRSCAASSFHKITTKPLEACQGLQVLHTRPHQPQECSEPAFACLPESSALSSYSPQSYTWPVQLSLQHCISGSPSCNRRTHQRFGPVPVPTKLHQALGMYRKLTTFMQV